MLKITPILCRAGKMDNYAYLLTVLRATLR